MSHRQCDHREAYLARGLSPDEAAAFADHLPGCSDCRREVAAQARIDALLRLAVERFDPLPADLLPKVESRIARHRRPARLAWAAAACAAVAVLLAFGGWAIWHNTLLNGHGPIIAQEKGNSKVEPSPVSVALSRPRAEVVMADPDAAIVVPHKSKRPDVTIVWIYPTIKSDEGPSAPESN